jgi:hypothetical protein
MGIPWGDWRCLPPTTNWNRIVQLSFGKFGQQPVQGEVLLEWGLRRTFSLKSDPYLYGPIVAVGLSSDNDNAPEVLVALFRDRPELLFAAGRILPRHDSDPGRSKYPQIRDDRRDRGGPNNPDTGDLEPLTCLVRQSVSRSIRSSSAQPENDEPSLSGDKPVHNLWKTAKIMTHLAS